VVTGLHPVVAVGYIPLVIGHGQRSGLRFGKFRAVTGIIVIPAIGYVSPVSGQSYLRRLRNVQLRVIAAFAASLAGLEILRKIEGLSKRKNGPKAETSYRGQKIFPETCFHIVRPSEEYDPRLP
jgi:hypothetical protein